MAKYYDVWNVSRGPEVEGYIVAEHMTKREAKAQVDSRRASAVRLGAEGVTFLMMADGAIPNEDDVMDAFKETNELREATANG